LLPTAANPRSRRALEQRVHIAEQRTKALQQLVVEQGQMLAEVIIMARLLIQKDIITSEEIQEARRIALTDPNQDGPEEPSVRPEEAGTDEDHIGEHGPDVSETPGD